MLSMQARAQYDIETINIENDAVEAYMADSTYFYNDDYATTVVDKYYTKNASADRKDWPRGKEVVWNATADAADIAEVRILVSQDSRFSNAVTHYTATPSDTAYVIRNMLPNETYYYRVEQVLNDNSRTQVAQGMFRTVGQVRMIQVQGSLNVRDMGGWPTQYGVPVKYGMLYRSGSLDGMKQEGRHEFAGNLGVEAELDLRGESKMRYSRLGDDKDYLLLPHGAYMDALNNRYKRYQSDLRFIIGRMREGKNVDWHCAIGCDRCGTLSFLIGGLLGLCEEDLCRDYELSTFSKYRRIRRHVKPMIAHVRKYGSPQDNLARCFYKYWLYLGMSQQELDYFLKTMLGKDV